VHNFSPVDPSSLLLPPCPIPRPGESVAWYTSGRPVRGTLTGFDGAGRPLIINQFLQPGRLDSFDEVRPEDPFNRLPPNWNALPSQSKVVKPDELILVRFRSLLRQPMPPGPSAHALALEIWNRGFEIYLVGGTVRDVIAGQESKDIDFVTTMPLPRVQALVSKIYGYKPTARESRGFIRIGGTPASGDPFIDLKVFSDCLPGTEGAAFGSSFERDVAFRDFACNAVYFDPINEVLIDPTGNGISDSISKTLTLVCSSSDILQHGQIFIRFFKFRDRGYSANQETIERINGTYAAGMHGMHRAVKVQYIRAQILNKCQKEGDGMQAIERIRALMYAHGAGPVWEDLIAPLAPQLLKRDAK
jgi:hypothetical protein